jgi:hypothetical protein
VLYAIELGDNLPAGDFSVGVRLSSTTGEIAEDLVCDFAVKAASNATPGPVELEPTSGGSNDAPTEAPATEAPVEPTAAPTEPPVYGAPHAR